LRAERTVDNPEINEKIARQIKELETQVAEYELRAQQYKREVIDSAETLDVAAPPEPPETATNADTSGILDTSDRSADPSSPIPSTSTSSVKNGKDPDKRKRAPSSKND